MKQRYNPLSNKFDFYTEPNFFAPTTDVSYLTVSPESGSDFYAGNNVVVTYSYFDLDNNVQSNTTVTIYDASDNSIVVQQLVSGPVYEANLTLPDGPAFDFYVVVVVSDGARTSDPIQSSTYYALSNAPFVENPAFVGRLQVGESITFTGTFSSPTNLNEGESIIKVYGYPNSSGIEDEELLYETTIGNNWTPISEIPYIKYVEFSYTPVDDRGGEGTPVRSSRHSLYDNLITFNTTNSSIGIITGPSNFLEIDWGTGLGYQEYTVNTETTISSPDITNSTGISLRGDLGNQKILLTNSNIDNIIIHSSYASSGGLVDLSGNNINVNDLIFDIWSSDSTSISETQIILYDNNINVNSKLKQEVSDLRQRGVNIQAELIFLSSGVYNKI